jgi:hypothetical protein
MQPEHVIPSSWRVSVSPPFQSQHPRTSMLGEVCACVFPSGSLRGLPGSMRQVSVAGPPLPRACDQAQATSRGSSGARNMREPSGDDYSAAPPLPVFIGAQAMPGADVAA